MAPRNSPRQNKVIFFDIGNVLVGFDAATAARKIAWRLSLNPFKIARYLWDSTLVDDIERGIMTPRQLYQKFSSEFGYAGDFAQFTALWCGHFELKKDSVALFRALARRYPIYLLSNINDLHYRHIKRRYAFVGEASGLVLSYRLGLRKPEPAIYRAALKMAGVRPGQSLFIDDLQENVDSARKLGIPSIRFTDAVSLREELRALGLLIK